MLFTILVVIAGLVNGQPATYTYEYATPAEELTDCEHFLDSELNQSVTVGRVAFLSEQGGATELKVESELCVFNRLA